MRKSFFVIGDSISIQYGPHLKKMTAPFLDSRPPDSPHTPDPDAESPAGVYSGDSSALIARLAERREELKSYDLLLFNSGLHDLRTNPQTGAKQVELTAYRANLATALDRIREIPVSPVWITITPVDEAKHNTTGKEFFRFNRDVLAYNQAAAGVMEKNGVPILDLHAFTLSLGTAAILDGVHFTPDTSTLQAAFLAGCLSSFARAL
ncbi:MAG: SGNH/GDSL hydrolase family protein [Planctomycetota bacterium]